MKKEKIIFWNTDTQKDFMNKDGALYVEGAESIKPNLKILTEFAKEHNIMVVNTQDRHKLGDKELSDNPDFITTFPNHCMKYTDGCDFINETSPFLTNYIYNENCGQSLILDSKSIIIEKNKFDVFEGNPHTEKVLEFINPDMIYDYGVATNVCVDKAVLGLAERGYTVNVVEDAIKELPDLPLQEVYDNWSYNINHKITRLTTKELLEHLNWQIKCKII